MAQDVRPYKSKEQDGQGNEIILRDQQLVEQTSQTTMASGEYFEIVDVDGRMAKIPKDNMIGVVREALGTLLNSLTDQTTVTKVPSLNGNTLGASTVATLALVLCDGGYIEDCNNALANMVCYATSQTTNKPLNMSGFVITFQGFNPAYRLQLYWTVDTTNGLFMRKLIDGVWYSWSAFTLAT